MFEASLDRSDVAFTGDALLPEYTPNVGGADVRVEKPLEKYLRALRRIADAGYARAWPGHRDPIDDPTGRAEHIVRHHEERAWRVLTALDESGPLDTWAVSAALFGELSGIHILHGPGEAYAHLEHLERAGAVTAEGRSYRIAESASDELERSANERWDLGV
jgi:glyoxylase-like metal-dependent hydrolase (beta-lactamase superfamily II)